SGIAGTLHGAWMTVKGALTSHSEHAILEETERGEDWSLKTYREAVARNLPVGIRSMIEQQYEQVQQAHQHIKLLREATAPKEPPPPPTQTPPPSVLQS
ncbi:MAG: PA2169 family four-helix-bundle protein, partial [Terriglobales bacterium]